MQLARMIASVAICALIAAGCGGAGNDSDAPSRHEIALLGKAEPPHSGSGPRNVVVPDIRGRRIPAAHRALRARGLLIHGRYPGTIANPSIRPTA